MYLFYFVDRNRKYIDRNVFLSSVDQKNEVKLAPGHVTPPAGQTVGSKCPFLAAEMVQKNNRVVREASLELQEDVQEMNSVPTGKQSHSHAYTYSKSVM